MRMFKRKLLKRALPVILSVAMILQSTPATALAAEDMETKTVEAQTQSADSSDSSDAKASDNSKESEETAAPDDASADKASREQTPNEQAAGEQKTEEPRNEESVSKEEQDNNSQTEANATVETNSEDSRTEEPKTDESKTQESNIQESGTEDSNSEKSEEDNSDNTQAEDTANSSEEQNTNNEQNTAEGTEIETMATEVEAGENETDIVNAESTNLETNIVINAENISSLLCNRRETYRFTQDTDAEVLTYKRPYNSSTTVFSKIVENLRNNSAYFNVEIDGETNSELLNNLEFQWQKVPAEGNPINLENEYPLDAGSYRLLITLDEVPEFCKKAEVVINFVIEPAELKLKTGGIFYSDNYSSEANKVRVSPNTTVASLKEKIKKDYQLCYTIIDENSYYPSEIIKDIDKDGAEFDIKATVVDAYDTTEPKKALEDTVQLAKNGDYRMYLEVVIPENLKANFTFDNTKLYLIETSDLVKPEVIVEKKNPGKEITTVYDASATDKTITDFVEAAIASKKVVYTEKDDNGEEKEIEIPISEENPLTLKWYVRYVKTINDEYENISEFDYKEYDGIPKDAGEYYVTYKYAGQPNVYEENESDYIKVTIEPISLILKPTASTAPTLVAGMTYQEVKEEVAKVGYELYPYTIDKDGKETLAAAPYLKSSDAEAQGFWGVSYNDKNVTQYYNPVFRLQYREAEKKDDGSLVKEGSQIKYGEWKNFNDNILKSSVGESGEKEIEYRIVFTGKKAVYYASGYGSEISVTDTSTMAAEKNYLVQADEETLCNDNYVLPVEINNAAATEIDITEIVNNFKTDINKNLGDDAALGTSEEKPLWKVYNRTPLYEKREAYKKAGVKEKGAAANFITNGSDEALTYQWYRKSGNYWSKVGGTAIDETMLYSNLTNAGAYKLVITYTDAKHNYQPAKKEVYYEIRQQEVIVVGEAFKAYVGDQTNQIDFKFRFYAVPDNQPDDSKIDLSQATQLSPNELFWEGITDYQLTQRLEWEVQRQEKKDTGEDIDSYVSAAGEQFIDGYQYRASLCLQGDFNNSQYTNVNQSASNEEIGTVYHQVWDKVELLKVGTEELELFIDKDKLPNPRVYDGTEQGVTEALKSAVTVVLKNDHTQIVSDIDLNFDLFYESNLDDPRFNGYVRGEEASEVTKDFVNTFDAGTYYLRVYFAGNEKYKNFDKTFNGEENVTDSNYSASNADEIYSFSVTKRSITIKPVITEEKLVAGSLVSELYDTTTTPVEINLQDIPECDRDKFTYGTWYNARGEMITGYFALTDVEYGWKQALFYPSYRYDNNENIEASYHLKYGKEYEVYFNSDFYANQLKGLYASNYDVTYQSAKYIVGVRGNAAITNAENTNIQCDVRLRSTITNEEETRSQKIVPLEAIPFTEKTMLNGKETEGNFFGFNIYAPDEFWKDEYNNHAKNFIYKNSIEAAGGIIIKDFPKYYDYEYDYNDDRYATIIFDVTNLDKLTDAEKVKTFSICWEDDYIEEFTVDFNGAELEADLRKAVAPKSLAFNGINTKMVIGENQNLDVKVAKVQLSDTIRIGYKTVPENSDTLYIDEDTGLVTALKVSSSPVTVQAYAYKMEDGERVPFDKPVATAKISVINVSSPTIKKIDAGDVNGLVHYTKVDNGYRRELYVLPGKNVSESTFQSEIEKLEKGQKTDLVAAPEYNVENSGSHWDEKAKEYTYTVPRGSGYWGTISGNSISGNGLKPNEDYSVYIRNVSAARTIVNGKAVENTAKGVVKSFKTTKPQVQQLVSFFNEDSAAKPVTNLIGEITDRDSYGYPNTYSVELASKSVQLSVWGLYKDTSANADTNDLVSQMLPLKGNSSVMNPKLTYYVYDYVNGYQDSTYINNTNLKPSVYASINNKGKITLKGVGLNGQAWLRVIVKADNGRINGRTLVVTAQPDAVKGKTAKLKVGDTINLWDYLDYTQARKKIPNYKSGALEIVNQAEAETAGLIIQNLGSAGCIVTATAEVKSGFVLKVKDNSLKSSPEAEAPTADIKLTAGALEPVKGLKIAYVDDQRITINFTHAGKPSDFLIEVKDGRGSLVSKKLVQGYNSEKQYWECNTIFAGADSSLQNRQQHIVGGLTYFEKTKNYAYTIDGTKNNRIVRQSAYSISVTAMYHDLASKTVTKKTKTTNIPASYKNLAVENAPYTGCPIYITRSNSDKENVYLSDLIENNPFLTSGNAYTLILANDKGEVPQTRATDSLTWKSSNPKVATIKANAGTYSAALKAVKAGETDIEVTSKITKKVIARYKVCVKTVSGGKTYYGDYEPTEDFRKWDPLYDGPVEVLTLSNKVSVTDKAPNERTWVSFTAPAFGEYSFTGYDNNSNFIWNNLQMYDEKNGETTYQDGYYVTLEANQKIYFKMEGNFTLEARCVTSFAKLTTISPVHVAKSAWVSFVAPEDNYYTFKVNSDDGYDNYFSDYRIESNKFLLDTLDENDWGDVTSYGASMKAGETILLKTSSSGTVTASCRVVEEKENANLNDPKVNKADVTLTNEIKERWLTYKAPLSGEYTFTITGTVDEIQYYKGLDSTKVWDTTLVPTGSTVASAFSIAAKNALAVIAEETGSNPTAPKETKVRIRMNADDIVAIKLTLDEDTKLEGDEAANGRKITVQVSQPEIDKLTISNTSEDPKTVTVGENGEAAWLSFTIPADGYYAFSAVDDEGNNVSVVYYGSNMNRLTNEDGYWGEYRLSIPYSSGSDKINAGDTIYLKIANSAKVSVKDLALEAVALTAGKAEPFSIEKNGQYWYTFTAKQEGDYVFRADDNMPAEEASSILERISARRYDKIGGRDILEREFEILCGGVEEVHLKMGETLTFAINASGVSTNSKFTGYIYVDSKATAQSITTKGADVSIDNAKDKTGTTKWYSFTATASGDYTFTWEADKAGSGDAEVTLHKNKMSAYKEYSTQLNLSTGDIVYIKVTQTTDKAVKGKLNIKAPTNVSAVKLTSGKESEAFTLTSGQTQYFTFVAPKTAKYIVKTTVTDPKDAAVSTSFDYVSDGTPSIGENGETDRILKAGKKYTLRVTTNREKAEFKILVQPVEVKELAADDTIEAENNTANWYVYKAPTAGRYSISHKANDKMTVIYYNKDFDTMDNQDISGYYYEAGEIIAYIKAATRENSKQSTTIKAEKAATTQLTVSKDDTAISLDANEWKYFTYTAANTDTHILTLSVPAANGVMADTIEYTVGMQNNFNTVDTGDNLISLQKGEKLFIRVTSSVKANFNYKIAERGMTELTAGTDSQETELAAGKTTYFSLLVRENGEFCFKTKGVSSKTADLSFTNDNFEPFVSTSTENGFCFAAKGTFHNRITFGVTNNSTETVKFKIGTERITYANLTEKDPIKDITLAKGGLYFIDFTAPEDGRYTFSCGDTEGFSLEGINVSSLYNDMPLEKDKKVTMYLKYSGSDNSAKTTVSVKHPVPDEITDKPIELEAGATKWVKYTSKKNGTYIFSLKDKDESEVYMTAYNGILSNNTISGYQITKWIRLDDIILIKLENNTSDKQSYTFTVTALEEIQTYHLTFDTYNETHDVTFTAPEDGTYRITGYVPLDYNSDFMVWVNEFHDNCWDEDEGWYGYVNVFYNESASNLTLYQKELSQGDEVYLDIIPWNYSDNNSSQYGGTISIQVEKIN